MDVLVYLREIVLFYYRILGKSPWYIADRNIKKSKLVLSKFWLGWFVTYTIFSLFVLVEWIYDCISKYKRFDSDFEKLLITCRLFFVIVMHFWQFSRSKWATKFLHRHRPALRFELQNMDKRYYKYGMFVMFGSFISPVLSSMRMDRFRDFGIAYVIINLEQISLYLIALATSATNNLIINKLKDEVFKFLKAISKPNTNCQSRNCHEHHKENVIVNDYERSHNSSRSTERSVNEDANFPKLLKNIKNIASIKKEFGIHADYGFLSTIFYFSCSVFYFTYYLLSINFKAYSLLLQIIISGQSIFLIYSSGDFVQMQVSLSISLL